MNQIVKNLFCYLVLIASFCKQAQRQYGQQVLTLEFLDGRFP